MITKLATIVPGTIRSIRSNGWDLLGKKTRELRIKLATQLVKKEWYRSSKLSAYLYALDVSHQYSIFGPALDFKLRILDEQEEIGHYDFVLTSRGVMRTGDFRLGISYQRKGIGSALFKLRDNIAKWFAQKTQMIMAVDNGRIVWAKKQFNTKFHNFDEIREAWQVWNDERGQGAPNLGNTPHKYPADFLVSIPWINYHRRLL